MLGRKSSFLLGVLGVKLHKLAGRITASHPVSWSQIACSLQMSCLHSRSYFVNLSLIQCLLEFQVLEVCTTLFNLGHSSGSRLYWPIPVHTETTYNLLESRMVSTDSRMEDALIGALNRKRSRPQTAKKDQNKDAPTTKRVNIVQQVPPLNLENFKVDRARISCSSKGHYPRGRAG